MKILLRGKFKAVNVHIRKEKKDLKSIICSKLRKLEKGVQIKSKASKRREIIISAEDNEIMIGIALNL